MHSLAYLFWERRCFTRYVGEEAIVKQTRVGLTALGFWDSDQSQMMFTATDNFTSAHFNSLWLLYRDKGRPEAAWRQKGDPLKQGGDDLFVYCILVSVVPPPSHFLFWWSGCWLCHWCCVSPDIPTSLQREGHLSPITRPSTCTPDPSTPTPFYWHRVLVSASPTLFLIVLVSMCATKPDRALHVCGYILPLFILFDHNPFITIWIMTFICWTVCYT